MAATVLCVQADRAICQLYVETLEAEGYQTLPAYDGGQALEILRRQDPDFILLDVSLPRQDGFEILVELRALRADLDIPVLMLCEGDATADLEARARQLGAVGLASAPIEADRLVGRIAQFVKPEATRAAARPPIASQGRLKQIPFSELMHGLHRDRLDGVLLLEHGKKKKAIEFRGGWPVCVKSNLVSECLGGYLVKQGTCTQEKIDESLARMRTGEGPQGEILVAMEVLDEDGVVAALEGHALEKLYEIFGWPDGAYQIRIGAQIQRGSSIALNGHPSNLVVHGVRRQVPLRWIDRFIASHPSAFVMPCTGSEGGLEDIDLENSEIEWIRALDGSLELAAIASEPEAIRRLVFGLLSVELLRIDGAAGNPEDARAVASTASHHQKPDSADSAADEALRSELARMANAMQDKDHYGVLGVSPTSGDEEIREAYARLAKQAHPDRFHGASTSVRQLATQVFERISQAHEGIASEEARADYAQQLSLGRKVAVVQDEGRRALQAETEFQRGEKMMQQRNYEGALFCFGRAMECFPTEGEYRAHYGWCLFLCHPDNEVMLAEALEHCREGLKLAKDREKPYLLLGRLYRAMGKPAAAKKMFTRAVQIKPQCVEAMRELRIMNMRREKDKGVLKRIFRR
jgi:CheY-like chemotaxis protein